MQGIWVVGVFFALAFLMIVGLHSVLRELLWRGPYTPYTHLYGDDDAEEVLSEGQDASGARPMAAAGFDDRDNRSIGVQARRA